MAEEQYSIESLRDLIKKIGVTIGSLKAAISEQSGIVVNYTKLISDLERGVDHGKSYTVEGLKNGIVQAEQHLEQLQRVRQQERERIKETQEQIAAIERAEEMSKMTLVIAAEYDDEEPTE